eukprot:scaffold214570_cov30-Tisochrysis_lutea.AAC.1
MSDEEARRKALETMQRNQVAAKNKSVQMDHTTEHPANTDGAASGITKETGQDRHVGTTAGRTSLRDDVDDADCMLTYTHGIETDCIERGNPQRHNPQDRHYWRAKYGLSDQEARAKALQTTLLNMERAEAKAKAKAVPVHPPQYGTASPSPPTASAQQAVPLSLSATVRKSISLLSQWTGMWETTNRQDTACDSPISHNTTRHTT